VTSLSSLSVLLIADSSSDSSKASFLAWSSLANTDSLCVCRNASDHSLTVSTGCSICNGRKEATCAQQLLHAKVTNSTGLHARSAPHNQTAPNDSKCQNSSQTVLLTIALAAHVYTCTHLGGALTSILSAIVWSITYAHHRGSTGISVQGCVYICTCTLYDDGSAINYTCTCIIKSLCNGV